MCVADAWTKMLLWHRAVSLRQHGSCYTKPQIYYLTTLVRRCVSTKQINIPTTYNIVYKLFKKSNSRNIRTTFFPWACHQHMEQTPCRHRFFFTH